VSDDPNAELRRIAAQYEAEKEQRKGKVDKRLQEREAKRQTFQAKHARHAGPPVATRAAGPEVNGHVTPLAEKKIVSVVVPAVAVPSRPEFLAPKPADWKVRWHRTLSPSEEIKLGSLERKQRHALYEVRRVVLGDKRASAISGPSGIGKSHMLKTLVEECHVDFCWHEGKLTPRELFIMFVEHGPKLFVLDDCEEATGHPHCIALLRSFCEMTGERIVYYRSGAAPKLRPEHTRLSNDELDEHRDDKGELPKLIRVKRYRVPEVARLILIGNDDLYGEAKKDRERSRKTGMAALVDRLGPYDIGHRDRHVQVLRLESLCAHDALGIRRGLSWEEEGELLAFFRDHTKDFAIITTRIFLDACGLRRDFPKEWRDMMPRWFGS